MRHHFKNMKFMRKKSSKIVSDNIKMLSRNNNIFPGFSELDFFWVFFVNTSSFYSKKTDTQENYKRMSQIRSSLITTIHFRKNVNFQVALSSLMPKWYTLKNAKFVRFAMCHLSNFGADPSSNSNKEVSLWETSIIHFDH